MATITIKDQSLIQKLSELKINIGNTPTHKIEKLFNKDGIEIYAKKEWEQLSGSVKIRAAYYIIKDAIESGKLTKEKSILDATSGNTGIAYAFIAKELGLKLTLLLPENATEQRKKILNDLGVDIIYTSKYEGTDGAQFEAFKLYAKYPEKYVYVDQYKNENNWKAHYHTTAEEIIRDVPGVTHFVAGLGTTGTFVGTGRRLKEWNSKIRLISLQPDSALHGLEGWKHLETAVIPKIYDPNIADTNLEVDTEKAYDFVKKAYELEGLKLSPSSAANLAGAVTLAERLNQGVIVTVLPDDAVKYEEIFNKLINS